MAEQESLRERKQRRAREAIVDAAYALFAEHGFDQVTVADIAERAEVGRTTFFRYFGDKQEVLFGTHDQALATLADLGSLEVAGSIGDSLAGVLSSVRVLVREYVRRIIDPADRFLLHERLVDRHPELRARALVKQRTYVELLRGWLAGHGVPPGIADLAAELGLACYHAGHHTAAGDPERLVESVDQAFDILTKQHPRGE